MKNIFLMIFSLLFFMITLTQQIIELKKQRSIKLINIFCITYGCTYGLLPFVYLILYKLFDVKVIRILYDEKSISLLWYWFTLAVLGYFFILFFYAVLKTPRSRTIEIIDQNRKKMTSRVGFRMEFTGVFCLVIGIVSLFLWSKAYGGIEEFISVANSVRGGWNDTVNAFAFMKHPSKIVLFSSYVFLKLIREKYKLFLNTVLFAVSVYFSFLYLMVNDGRMTMAIYFAILMFIWFDLFAEKINISKKVVTVAAVGFVAVVLIMNMDAFTASLRGSELEESNSSLTEGMLEELSYIIAAGQTSTNEWVSKGTSWLFVDDILSGVFSWLPTSLKPGNFTSIWSYNTELYLQNPELKKTGTIPTDYISTSIYDFGLIGCLIFAAFWAYIIKILDKKKRKNTSPFFEVVFYSFAMAIFRLVNYCYLYDFILGLFNVFIAAVIWWGSGIVADVLRKRE